MKNIPNVGQKGLNSTCKPRHGSTIVAMLILFSHFIACNCSKNSSGDPHSNEHSSGGTISSTSSSSASTGNPGGGGNIPSNSIDIKADMLNPLANDNKSDLVKKRLEKYLAPNAGIAVDEQDQKGKTMLLSLASCMNVDQLPLGVQDEKNTKRQQAMIDVANALLNRGARSDIPDNNGVTPLLYMADHCVDTYKNKGTNIDRAKEIALLQKMLQTPKLVNTDAKFAYNNKSAYEIAQAAGDQEVLGLLKTAGINS
jgi:hypothetical protein